MIACDTQATDGMKIDTHTPEIEEWRQSLLRLLAQQYPGEDLRQFPDKEFHRFIRAYGLERECLGHTSPALVDESNPYIRVDMSRCIYCYRCVRICDDVQGQFVWEIWNRGDAGVDVPLTIQRGEDTLHLTLHSTSRELMLKQPQRH